MFAAAVWRTLFADDPLDRDAGEIYRKKVSTGPIVLFLISKHAQLIFDIQILSKGGGEDPRALLRDVLGGEPSFGPLLDDLGIKDS